jgi:hypothetical protein
MRVSSWSFVGTVATATMLAATAASFAGDVCTGAANSCCVAGTTPGCSDTECCNQICALDPFCCSVTWDGICAGAAVAQCSACSANCTVDCAAATVEEGEICGNDDNGGCNNPANLVSALEVGDVVCGSYWAEASIRDTDWYEFTVTENKVLTFSVEGEIPTNLFLATASCPASVIQFAQTTPGSCAPAVLENVCVPAGTYRVIVTPQSFEGSPCSNDAKYLLSVIDTGTTCTAAPGDTCDDAIPASLGANPVDTNGAFTNGDPLPAECASFGAVTMFNDVWYTFTPSESGLYEVSTCGSVDFDSRLAVYSGDCTALNLIGCNDDGDGCPGFTSKLLASLDAGVEYKIRLGGFGAAEFGTGTLTIQAFQPCEPCPSGSIAEAELCGEDLNGGCNGGGVYQDVSLPATVCGTFWADASTRDTDWYRFSLAESATVTMTVNANTGVTIALLDANCPPLIYAIEAQPGCGATLSFCVPAGDNVFFVAPSSFNGLPCGDSALNEYNVTVTIGDACTPITCGSPETGSCCVAQTTPFCNDAECCNTVCSLDPFCCSTAWDAICADAASSLCAICAVDPPANDECATAVVINNGTTPFSTLGATDSGAPLDPSCDEGFGLAFVQDIWYEYTATCTGTATFSTCGQADFDTRLALYTGSCDNLEFVACNDDGPGCPGFSSLMSAEVVAGQTYFLRVGGFGGDGSGSITIECGGGGGGITNDECTGATPLALGGNPFSTIGATGQTVLPSTCTSFGSVNINNDVWFTYTATATGTATVSTCGTATFDTRLGVFGGSCTSLEFIACNDDAPGCTGFTSTVTFEAVCGETYYVVLGAFATTGVGTGTVTVTQAGTCPVNCPADLDGDGQVGAADLAILLGQWGGAGSADLNNNGNVGAEDLALLLGEWGPC